MTDGNPPSNPPQPDPYAPVDYPASPYLPPPVYGNAYPPPSGYGPPGAQAQYPPAAGGYPYGAYDPYRPAAPIGTNGKATASLVTSLVGLMCCGLPSVVGLILGVIAMRETRATGQDGYGLALAGTIIGALVTIGYVVYFVLVFGILASGFTLV